MLIHNYFVFDGKSSLDFGVGISGNGTFRKSHRRVERFTVPGRNGTLTISDGTFEDVEIVYPAYFVEGFPVRYDALTEWLYSKQGMKRLEDTYHPEHFRLGEFVGDLEPDMGTLNRSGRFEIAFNCDGRKFMKSGERIYIYDDENASYMFEHPGYGRRVRIINPTMFPSKPILLFPSLGDFYVNDSKVSLSGGTIYDGEENIPDIYFKNRNMHMIAFDSDSHEMYSTENVATSWNHLTTVSGDPVLYPGENYLIFSHPTAGLTYFGIIPRWYKV